MLTQFGKTQFDAERPNVPALGLDRALGAEIADGDFRTFVLLCQLAVQEQPGSDVPYTERSYADLARLHPGRQRPTAETVRGRLYRLTQAGLIRRQRAGRTTWRTYPHLDGARIWTAVTTSANPINQEAQTDNLPVRSQSAKERTLPPAPSARASRTHPELDTEILSQDKVDAPAALSASPRPTQAAVTPSLGARGEVTQPAARGWTPSVEGRVEPPVYGSLALSATPKATAPRIVRPSGTETAPLGAYACRSQGLTLQPNPMCTLNDLIPAWKPVRTADPAQTSAPLPAHPEHTQPDTPLTAHPEHTQPEPEKAVETTPVAVVSAQPEHTQPERVAEECATATAVGVQSEHTQTTPDLVGVQPERTQPEQTTPGETLAPVVGVPQVNTDPVGVEPEHTQTQAILPVVQEMALRVSLAHPQASAGTVASVPGKSARQGGQPSRAHTRARASVLSGTDSLSSEKSSSPQKEKTETDSTGHTNATATPRHPVLERVDVPAGYEGLAIQLATLKPEGMNYEGIAECLRQPELTRAWTEWTLAKGDSIHNPPAFIRQRVRAGQPPAAEKPIPPHQRLVRNPNRMGWDEPARADVRYVTYQSLYNIPRTQEVKHDPTPSRPAGDAHPRETLH